MNHESFFCPTDDLYIRIPEETEEGTVLKIVIPKKAFGKTMKVSVVKNTDTPFRRDAISADGKYSTLRYLGSDEYWKPEEITLLVVAGNHNCTYEECCGECHNVNCGVFEGFSNEDPEEITYIRSDVKRTEM